MNGKDNSINPAGEDPFLVFSLISADDKRQPLAWGKDINLQNIQEAALQQDNPFVYQ